MRPFYLNGVPKDENATLVGLDSATRRPALRSGEDRRTMDRIGKKRARAALKRDLADRLSND